MYTFYFETCDKRVHLTQEQLNLIPYLSTLVAHDNDFSSIRNKNGEYILSDSINYSWFTAILHSITSREPYILFDDLPTNKNVLHMLQLFDYLGITPYSVPLLKFAYLVQINSTHTEDKRKDVKYRYATMSEAQQMAAEFILALSRTDYDLNDSRTMNNIFSLVMVILLNSLVFSFRFRHHMLTIVKQYCFSSFSKAQQDRLLTIQPIVQRDTSDSKHLHQNSSSRPKNFHNAFAWKFVDVSTEKNDRNYSSTKDNSLVFWPTRFSPLNVNPRENLLEEIRTDLKNIKKRQEEIEVELREKPNVDLKLQLEEQSLLEQVRIEVQLKIERDLELQLQKERHLELLNRFRIERDPALQSQEQNICPNIQSEHSFEVIQSEEVFERIHFDRNLVGPSLAAERLIELELQTASEMMAQFTFVDGNSVRSGRFNTLSKRPKIDKFKHPFGSKFHKKY